MCSTVWEKSYQEVINYIPNSIFIRLLFVVSSWFLRGFFVTNSRFIEFTSNKHQINPE